MVAPTAGAREHDARRAVPAGASTGVAANVLAAVGTGRPAGNRTRNAMYSYCAPRADGTSAVHDSAAEALAVVEATGERFYEAELHRLRGELLLRQEAGEGRPSPAQSAAARPHDPDPSGHPEAEACFRQALEIAHRQGAKSLELRAALSLARLLEGSGRSAEGRRRLAATLGWFTEGRDTPDQREARAVLEGCA